MFLRLDTEGFHAVYKRFRKPIFKYVWLKVRDSEVAEEITQDVFMKAYKARESYQPHFGITTWLWTIAKNTLCDFHRRNEASAVELEGSTAEELPCPAPSVESLLADHGERKELMRRMGRLTELQKKVLQLRVIHRLSYSEIARQLGLSLSASKCLFYRAKIALLEGTVGAAPAFA